MSIATPTNHLDKAPLRPKIPDFCPACDATDAPFEAITQTSIQEFRGETFRVATLAHRCRNCDFEVAPAGALESLRRATTEAYRIRKGLLSPAEIIARRRAMEMTQSAFAKHVGVGIASLQRWEKGVVVQDEASDRLLRDSTRHTTFVFEDVAGLKNRSEWQESIRIEGKILKRTFEELLSAKKSRTTGSPSTEPDRFILNDSTLATAA